MGLRVGKKVLRGGFSVREFREEQDNERLGEGPATSGRLENVEGGLKSSKKRI